MINENGEKLRGNELKRTLFPNVDQVSCHDEIDEIAPTFGNGLLIIEDIDNMNGLLFEAFLHAMFTELGYLLEQTKASGDKGVDVFVSKNDITYAVQAKSYTKSVPNSVIQEVVAGMQFYDADESIVVTNSLYTKSAILLAEKTGTQLWDREKLIHILDILKLERSVLEKIV